MSFEEKMKELERIRSTQNELYADMDRFTIQTILTYLHNSPMTVEEIYDLQSNITETITERDVIKKLEDLVHLGYATKVSRQSYEPTEKSLEVLNKEGLSKEFLFNN